MARGKRGATSNAGGANPDVDGTTGRLDVGNGGSDSTVAADSGPAGYIEPGSITAATGSASGDSTADKPKRKYTRRASSTGDEKTGLGVGTIEKLLHSIHLGVSFLTQMPEMALSPDESAQMAKAAADVARHYPAIQASEKVQDWGNLIMCAAFIYGPRLIAIRNNKRTRRAQTNANVPPAAPMPAPNGRSQFTEVEIPGIKGKVQVPVDGWPQ